MYHNYRNSIRDSLDPEDTNVSQVVATDVCLKVSSSVRLSKSFPLFGTCSPLCCFLCTRCHVMEMRKQTSTLGGDD